MAYFHCLIGGGSSGGGYELTVTCDAEFAGTTITCTDGVTTLTQTCPSASPYEVVFAIPNGGEWTISGIISGQTYSASIDIPDSLELHSVPEGSTVLPTDDIQIWLACAGITDKSYTTLAEVLADSTTLLALMSNNNAVDYLVRSTTWASGITADSTAMTDIGANNYCADTLLSDSTWAEAIYKSTYFESVLNAKVPTMTSNTTPEGECFQDGSVQVQPYMAFNGATPSTSSWTSYPGDSSAGIGYKFVRSTKVTEIKIDYYKYGSNAGALNYPLVFKLQGSNDGTTWTDISDDLTLPIPLTSVQTAYFDVANGDEYLYYKLKFSTVIHIAGAGACAMVIQFWGRVDV